MIEVINPGSTVRPTMNPELEMLVLAVTIRGPERLQYECSWFNGGTYCSGWFQPSEIVAKDNTPTAKIGFKH